jgi:hypothetical protein
MKRQLSKPARTKATYTDQYKQEALDLWRASGGNTANPFLNIFRGQPIAKLM